jgi:hypothetical protein
MNGSAIRFQSVTTNLTQIDVFLFNQSEAGTYTCEAKNLAGTRIFTKKVVIKAGKLFVFISKISQNMAAPGLKAKGLSGLSGSLSLKRC